MNRSKKIFIGIPIALFLIIGLLYLFNPFLFWHIESSYKTQEIIFLNKKDKDITIEYQMQDSGAFGYNSRIVKVTKGFIYDTTQEIDTSKIDKSNWERVDIYLNELGLKGG